MGAAQTAKSDYFSSGAIDDDGNPIEITLLDSSSLELQFEVYENNSFRLTFEREGDFTADDEGTFEIKIGIKDDQ